MTRYMMFLKATPESEAGVPPDTEVLIAMGNLMQDMAKAGVLLAGEGLKPSSESWKLSYKDGQRTIIDGPFAETKELVAGFCMIRVDSFDELLQWADRFAAVAGDHESEIRPLFEVEDFENFPPEEQAKEQKLRDELQAKTSGRA